MGTKLEKKAATSSWFSIIYSKKPPKKLSFSVQKNPHMRINPQNPHPWLTPWDQEEKLTLTEVNIKQCVNFYLFFFKLCNSVKLELNLKYIFYPTGH